MSNEGNENSVSFDVDSRSTITYIIKAYSYNVHPIECCPSTIYQPNIYHVLPYVFSKSDMHELSTIYTL